MSIESVDMDRALTSQAYAQQVLRSGNVSAEQKGQLAAKWGADNVNKWISVDSTKYEIDDVSYDAAKDAGKDAAKDSTGYDGGKSYASVKDAVVTVGAHVAGQTVLKNVAAPLVDKLATGAIDKAQQAGKNVKCDPTGEASFIVGCTMGLAEGIRYMAEKPNEEQVDAANHLLTNELPESMASLSEAQGMMADASEEVTELTEEAESINEDANQKIEEDKTIFDFYKMQYEALKAKKERGEQLTPDEQALMKQLAPMMEDMNEDITSITENTSGQVNDLNDEIGEYQEVFDESAETIAEVEGVTDYAENFDENTRTMCYVEGVAQGINAGMSGYSAFKAGRFAASGGWFTAWAWAFAAMGTAGAAFSTKGASEQMRWAKNVGDEIDVRREVQDIGSQTTDMYDEELDNFAGNIETVEDLELEIPEDMETPAEQGGAATSMMSMAAQNGNDEKGQTTPMGTQKQDESPKVNNDNSINGTKENEKDDNNKKKPEE